MLSCHMWRWGLVSSPWVRLEQGQNFMLPLLESPAWANWLSKRQPGALRVLQPPKGVNIGKRTPL